MSDNGDRIAEAIETSLIEYEPGEQTNVVTALLYIASQPLMQENLR